MSSDDTKTAFEARHHGRRQFLVSVSSSFLLLPPLMSLMPKTVAAQVVGGRKNRSVIMQGILGIDPHQFFPRDQADLSVAPNAESVRYKRLDSFSGPISLVIDAEFAPMYPKMNLIEGMSLTGGSYQGHNTSVLSGSHSGGRSPTYGKSIDVIMEKSPGVYRSTDSVVRKAVRIANGPNDAFSFDRVNGSRVITDKVIGDRALFNTLFSKLTGTSVASPSPLQSRSKLIVDQVRADLKLLESNPRLSSADRVILDQYISSVFELQKNVQANQVGSTVQCAKPAPELQATGTGNVHRFPGDPGWGIRDVGKLFNNYMDMIKVAFACDLTRVVYIGNSTYVESPDRGGGLHHEAPSSEIAADRQRWGLKKLLYLATALDGVKDPFGTGTLLDNSILLYLNELGAWTTSHNTFNNPMVTFGGGAGYFKTGYFVDYRQLPLRKVKNYYIGRPMKQLLQSIMLSMGVPRDEYMRHGDGNGFGEFKAGINQFGFNDPTAFSRYAREHNEPLPFLSNIT